MQIDVYVYVYMCICRMEKVRLKRRAGKVKIMGAILCVGGALITCLYKGKGFHIIGHHHHQHDLVTLNTYNNVSHWGRGTLLLLGSCFSYATWFVVQVYTIFIFCLLLFNLHEQNLAT